MVGAISAFIKVSEMMSICQGLNMLNFVLIMLHQLLHVFRADSGLAPNQWETSLQSYAISHWLDANLESALCFDYLYLLLLIIYWFCLQSINSCMHFALHFLSNSQHPCLDAIYLNVPEPLEARDPIAKQLYPWRTFLNRYRFNNKFVMCF